VIRISVGIIPVVRCVLADSRTQLHRIAYSVFSDPRHVPSILQSSRVHCTVFLAAAKSRTLEPLAFDEYCRFDSVSTFCRSDKRSVLQGVPSHEATIFRTRAQLCQKWQQGGGSIARTPICQPGLSRLLAYSSRYSSVVCISKFYY
jgi:hypothetical protein